jgi:hypothetical protein
LVDHEQRAVQLIPRVVIDPRRALTVGSSMIGISLISEAPGGIYEISLERRLSSQALVETKIVKQVAHPLREGSRR